MQMNPLAETQSMTSTKVKDKSEFIALQLMFLLTFVTGVVDSVGYLGLDRVFVGNMTGNIVILGMGVAGADELPVLGPVIALAAFTAGAFLSGLSLRTQPRGWTRRVTLCLSAGSIALISCTVAAFSFNVEQSATVQITIASATAAAMGVQAAVARKLAVTDMTTVVVTSTLTSLASESWTSGGFNALRNRRTGAIIAILAGAIVGAFILRHTHIGVAMTLAAVLTVIVTTIGHYKLIP